jgi:hypothetical protein
MAIPPWPNGVAMAAMESVLSFLEKGTGFLVTFALEVMPQIGGRVGGQLQDQFIQPREKGPQVGLGRFGRHAPSRLFQFQQRVKNLAFRLCHNRSLKLKAYRGPRKKHGKKFLAVLDKIHPEEIRTQNIIVGQFKSSAHLFGNRVRRHPYDRASGSGQRPALPAR